MKARHMKYKITSILVALLLVSCARGDKKETQLARLRAQHDKIAEQIKKLEEETVSDKGAGIAAAKVFAVSVNEIKPQRFNHYVEVQGKLDGEENVAVNPQIGGIVVAKFAGVGDRVSRSQVLAQLDDAALEEQIKGARAQVDLARETYTRKESLSDQKIYSEMDYLKDKTQMEVAEKTLAALLQQADMYKIRSPIDGTIAEASFKMGQMVSPAQPTPAYRVVNFAKLKVTAEVAEAYATKVKKGDEVSIYFPDLDRDVNAQVDFASDYISPVNRTFIVEAHVPDSAKGLKVNMIAVLKINDYRSDGAVAISVNSVLTDQRGSYVFIAEALENGYAAKKRYVTLGQVYNGIAEVKEGLKEGDKVITVGFQNLEESDAVSY
jgi:membrane fusion protein (multidrug efflux system)